MDDNGNGSVFSDLNHSGDYEERGKCRINEIQSHGKMKNSPQQSMKQPGIPPIKNFLSGLNVTSPQEFLTKDIEEEKNWPDIEYPEILIL